MVNTLPDAAWKKEFRGNSTFIIALIWVAFQCYIAMLAGIPTNIQRAVHVAFACALVFLTKPALKEDGALGFSLDMACAVFCLTTAAFFLFNGQRYLSRIAYISPVFAEDLILGVLTILLVVECCRRSLGMGMTLVALFFIAYAFVGPWLPGIFNHGGSNLSGFVELQFMTTNGLYGSPAGVSVDTIFYFMIFGAFLSATPAGTLFISLAHCLTRRAIGGAGKASVLTSVLFGMISGSAAANVATVGILTYPPMEKAGFKPIFGASMLSIAGTSGQLIPPIMGAASFLMANFLGVSYFKIVACAIIPSFLYVLSCYFLVHFEAKRCAIPAPVVDMAEVKRQIKSYAHLSLPLILLVAMIAMGRSLMNSAVVSVGTLLLLCSLRKDTRMGVVEILKTMASGAVSAMVVAVPCAVAGIVAGILTNTGFGLKISALIASFSQGNLMLALLLSMAMIIILGMGMPTSAAYIMSAVLLAPALQKMDVPPLVAHFFIFYFANLSTITPPVALASYTAAGIAKTPFWETGMEAFRLGMPVYLIPIVFAYSPALLGLGSPLEILWGVGCTSVALLGMSAATIGYFNTALSMAQRLAITAGALAMICPWPASQAAGAAVLALTAFYLLKGRRLTVPPAQC